ncbi:MAG TPA: GNAT family N-acetyltransferase [Candidatus Dormibacteraeota bacterium]
MSIRRLGPEDWQQFRKVRLAALQEAPYAFGSTFELEVAADEDSWRRRIVDWARFIAEVEGEVAGTVGAGAGEFALTVALTALWVDPRFRSRGIGGALVGSVVDWAASEGCTQVLLWVTEMNKAAERLYEHHGFARTGRVDEVRRGEPAVEYEMSKRI